MKTFVSIAFMAVLCMGLSSNSFSQIRLGVYGGLNLADCSHADEYAVDQWMTLRTAWEMQPKSVFGLTLEYAVGSHGFVYISPRYTQKGAKKYSFGGLGRVYDGHFRFNYIELPVGYKYVFDVEKIKPVVFGGFAAALPLYLEKEDDKEVRELIDEVTEIDYLLNIGCGLEFRVYDNTCLDLTLQYSRSLQSINQDIDGGRSDIELLYTSDIMLTVGVLWDI